MAFMLGSFTSGMFSGLNDTIGAFNNVEKYKQNKIETQRQQTALDAAAATRKTIEDGDGAPGSTAVTGTTTGGTGGSDASLPPVKLDSVPQPAHMQPKTDTTLTAGAIKSIQNHNLTESGANNNPAPAATASSPMAAGISPGEMSPPTQAPTGPSQIASALSTPGSGPPMTPTQMYGGSSSPNMSPTQMYGNAGAATPSNAGSHMYGQTSPIQSGQSNAKYDATSHPGGNTPPWGPRRATTAWGHPTVPPPAPTPSQPGQPATAAPNATQQQAPVAGGPGTAPAYGSTPTLGNSTGGVGAQLLQSMNMTGP